MMSLLLTTLLACAVTRTGLVHAEGEGVSMTVYDGGARLALALDDVSAPLRGADGVVVEVRGPLVGGRLRVRDWRVLDAGDGSGGFVGPLVPWGARLRIEDRNSGSTLLVDDASAVKLRGLEGHTVLLMGHVIGGGIIEVVAVRDLTPGPSGTETK